MEPFLPFLLTLLPLSLFFFFAYRNKKPNTNLPPGKSGWPIIGETLEFASLARKGKPAKFINDRIQKYSSTIFKTCLFGENFVVFCGSAGNKFLYSNENQHVTSWWPLSANKVIAGDRSDYAELGKKNRIHVLDFLKLEAIQNYIPIMDSMAQNHINLHWAANKKVKVAPLSTSYTFSLACRLFLNVEDVVLVTRLSKLFHLVMDGLMSVPISFPGTAYNKAIKAGADLREEIVEIIVQRKRELAEMGDAKKTPDLLTSMLLSNDENDKFLSENEIPISIFGLCLASNDTTASAITSVLYYLADFPQVYDLVYNEQMEIAKFKKTGELLSWDDIQKMKYSWNVACEAMRLLPPSQGAFREAIHDFTYNGFTIPKGWKVFWNVYSTHRNPIYFPNPDKFDPSRFERKEAAPFTFVPFGGGPRMCIGKEFARVVILVFMHNVVTKFKWDKSFPDEKIIYNPSPTPIHGLPIHLHPHKN